MSNQGDGNQGDGNQGDGNQGEAALTHMNLNRPALPGGRRRPSASRRFSSASGQQALSPMQQEALAQEAQAAQAEQTASDSFPNEQHSDNDEAAAPNEQEKENLGRGNCENEAVPTDPNAAIANMISEAPRNRRPSEIKAMEEEKRRQSSGVQTDDPEKDGKADKKWQESGSRPPLSPTSHSKPTSQAKSKSSKRSKKPKDETESSSSRKSKGGKKTKQKSRAANQKNEVEENASESQQNESNLSVSTFSPLSAGQDEIPEPEQSESNSSEGESEAPESQQAEASEEPSSSAPPVPPKSPKVVETMNKIAAADEDNHSGKESGNDDTVDESETSPNDATNTQSNSYAVTNRRRSSISSIASASSSFVSRGIAIVAEGSARVRKNFKAVFQSVSPKRKSREHQHSETPTDQPARSSSKRSRE